MHYPIEVAGLKRDLPLFPISDELQIAAFIMLGDQELTVACASALLEKAPEYDYMLTAEAKGIPLIHEMARQAGAARYFVARKKMKLFLTEEDAALMKGRRILIVDDVISTGKSLEALEKLVEKAGGIVVGRAAVLAEGEAAERTDITFLEPLPLFNKAGEAI